MKKSALIIIDMINEYLNKKGLLYCEPCRKIIPAISECLSYARKENIQIIYVNTSLNDESDLLVKKWDLHAVPGTFGSEVIDELKPEDGDLIIRKKLYNGFAGTILDTELKKRKINDIAISGIHTHVCVLLTAVGGFELGYNVTLLEDCITTDTKEKHESRLPFFKTHVGELLSLEEWKKSVVKNII